MTKTKKLILTALSTVTLIVGVGLVFDHLQKPLMDIQRIERDDLPLFLQNEDDLFTAPVSQHATMIKLHDNSTGRFFCSAFVVSDNYAITAAHCVVNSDNTLNTDNIEVRNSRGQDTKITAKAVALQHTMDRAIILGDFRNFEKVRLASKTENFFPTVSQSLVICGFPGGQDLLCVPFVPMEFAFFSVLGLGPAYPGMSGGILLDLDTQSAVGIISARTRDGLTVINPVTAIEGLLR
jgi:hypothetical protein